MLNLTVNCKNCSYVCAYRCSQLWYTIQHRRALINFPRILQTVIIAQMLSTGGEAEVIFRNTVYTDTERCAAAADY